MSESLSMAADPTLHTEPVRRLDIPFLRKWTSFGTGIGILVEANRLEAVLLSVRPQGIQVLDVLQIQGYRERPAAEWGAEYDAFLRKHQIKHVAAVAVLPSRDIISRTLEMSGVGDRELDAAVRYQLDGLHPFAEDEAASSFARLQSPHQSTVALAISRADVVNDYATIFEEAGVDLAGFTSPAAAYYSALRILQLPPQDQFLATREKEDSLEIYAETPTHPLYFVELAQESTRAVAFAASQVRLNPSAPVVKLASQLPVAASAHVYSPLAFAAALVSALPRQALRLNLLPASRRRVTSRLRWVPTLLLLTVAVAMAAALAYFQEFENRRLIAQLEEENRRLAPRIAAVRDAESKRAAIQKKLDALNDFARQPREDLDSLREMTRLIPPPAWISRLDLSRNTVILAGETDQATEMLGLIDNSPLFANSEFITSLGRSPNGKELFQIRTQREKPKTPPVAAPALPAGVVPGLVPGVTPGVPPAIQPGTPLPNPAGGIR